MNDTTTDSTTAWARANGTAFSYTAALDNYEPVPRNYAHGTLYAYSMDDTRGDGIILDGRAQFKDSTRAIFLIDDGRTVQPYYVAAWHPEQDHLILHPFPTNYNADGSPKVRVTDSRPVDYGSWMLGPHRAYHLKVRETDPAQDDPLYRLLDEI